MLSWRLGCFLVSEVVGSLGGLYSGRLEVYLPPFRISVFICPSLFAVFFSFPLARSRWTMRWTRSLADYTVDRLRCRPRAALLFFFLLCSRHFLTFIAFCSYIDHLILVWFEGGCARVFPFLSSSLTPLYYIHHARLAPVTDRISAVPNYDGGT